MTKPFGFNRPALPLEKPLMTKQTILSMLVATMVLLSGCTLMKPTYRGENIVLNTYPYSGSNVRPQVVATYCPAFIQATSSREITVGARVTKLEEVRPLRDHAGNWTDEAMRYDLDAMQACGLQGVLLMIRPSDLIDTHHLERIRQFYSLCATRRPVFSVGLLLFSETPLDMGTGNVAQFLSQNGFASLPAALRGRDSTALSNSMLVVFDTRNIHLNWQHFAEERQFEMRPWNGNAGVLPGGAVTMLYGGDSGAETQVSNSAQQRWPIPRGDGSFLANALRRSFVSRSPLICIHSWNWFRDGSFMTPNTLDGTLLATILREEMDHLEELRLKSQQGEANNP